MLNIKHYVNFFKKNPGFLPTALCTNKYNLKLIYTHPFNQNLLDGTLCPNTFGRYLRDDYFYLNQFSQVLKNISERSIKIDPNLAYQLNHLSGDIINNEQSMQLQYKEHLITRTPHQPGVTISAYADYLLKRSKEDKLAIALSSVLPCFWIYHQLGMMQTPDKFSTNPYNEWIATYSSNDFTQATCHLVKLVNDLGDQSDQELQTQMHDAFKRSVQFELDFFDDVYRFHFNKKEKEQNSLFI